MRKIFAMLVILVLVSACGAKAPHATATPEATPRPTSEPIPTAEILVEAGYYPDNGSIVENDSFEPYETTIISLPQEGDLTSVTSMFEETVVAVYCGQECLNLYATQGESARMHDWQQNMRFYVEFEDGTYAELALNPPPPLACTVLGIYIDNEDVLYVHIEDFDGQEKMSVWQISELGVSEIDTLPFVEETYDFGGHYFANSGFAAMMSRLKVNVFNADNRIIGEALPCAAG